MWLAERVFARAPGGLPAFTAIIATSWLALWAWGASSYSRYLDHDYQPEGAGPWAIGLVLFVGGWLLMSAAMMLPTATELLSNFARVVVRRPGGRRLQATVVAGFLTTWLVTGYLFRVFDVGVHFVVESSTWIEQRSELIAGATLIGAGMFEFTSLKHRCLTACRSPRSFVYRHWRGGRPAADAFRVGLSYGVSCVGCCWALMLVVFALGTVNLAWMLAFAAVMVVEKSTRFGHALVAPVGGVLVAAGLAMIVA
jgi:predicted metal-binding membrane protein